MFGFFMFLFVLISIFLVLLVLIQSGKGDMGLGSLGRGGQLLFGGSGGQDIFEKATWVLGTIFMIGALGLTLLKTKQDESSLLSSYKAPIATQKAAPQSSRPQGLPQSTAPQEYPAESSTDRNESPAA